MLKVMIFAVAMWIVAAGTPGAQEPVNWQAIQAEALGTLQAYIRIDTSNPPGHVGPAVDLLAGVLKRDWCMALTAMR